MKNIDTFDWFEFMAPIVIVFTLVGVFTIAYFEIKKEEKINKEIIKQSEEYTIFKECTEIQGKYYCK